MNTNEDLESMIGRRVRWKTPDMGTYRTGIIKGRNKTDFLIEHPHIGINRRCKCQGYFAIKPQYITWETDDV